MVYLRYDDGPWCVFASYGGGSKNPVWFHNAFAHPEAEISIGYGTIERFALRARVLEGAEHDEVYAEQERSHQQFAEYELKSTRESIPVVELMRI